MTNGDQTASPQPIVSEETKSTNQDQPFEERLEGALRDEDMHRALERFAPSWRASRGTVFASQETDYGPEL